MKISYRAPAKVILSGEQAAVYGKPALACAIDRYLTFTVEEEKDQLDPETNQAIQYIEKLVKKYLQKNNLAFKERKYRYSIDSQIPLGRGLGSSAAFSVTTVAALMHFYTGQEPEKSVINGVAYQAEKFFHGKPSGLDVSTSCFGGLIFYRKEFEFLKSISSLQFKISQKIQDNLYLIDSGQPQENTAEMVQLVGKNYNRHPLAYERIFNAIEKITKRIVVSIIKEDLKLFQSCLQDNERWLEKIEIVSEQTKELLKKLQPFGVGKVTGAGGKKASSGFILFYSTKEDDLKQYCHQTKLSIFKLRQDIRGLYCV